MNSPVRGNDDPQVRAELFAHVQHLFGICINAYETVQLGFYHMKWIVRSSSGSLFIKYYHPKRVSLSDPNGCGRSQLERSLLLQQTLHEQTGCCPRLWSDGERLLHMTSSGHWFIVMDAWEARSPAPGRVAMETVYRIGKATGSMHAVWSRFPIEGEIWIPAIADMERGWAANVKQAMAKQPPDVRAMEYMERQGRILAKLDVADFAELTAGWTHWDLWTDNMLVTAEGAVGLVDFDKALVSYPEIDIARALLSCAWHEGELAIEAVSAFLEGYREEWPFARGRLPLALKLLWCREANWWLKAGMDDASRPPKRFAAELVWLTDHWGQLEQRYAQY